VFITDHQLADIIAQYDTNGDGKIGFREYCAMVGVD
jgi:Ca2+-binding EF-hand superfamily protein